MAGREDLINQLAASMGAGDFARTRYEESRYDPETGTLYCDGIAISRSTIEKAEQHFKGLKAKCDYSDPASREMAMIYQIALEGIKALKAQNKKQDEQTKEQG